MPKNKDGFEIGQIVDDKSLMQFKATQRQRAKRIDVVSGEDAETPKRRGRPKKVVG